MNLVCCFQFQVMSNITFLFEKSNKNLTGIRTITCCYPIMMTWTCYFLPNYYLFMINNMVNYAYYDSEDPIAMRLQKVRWSGIIQFAELSRTASLSLPLTAMTMFRMFKYRTIPYQCMYSHRSSLIQFGVLDISKCFSHTRFSRYLRWSLLNSGLWLHCP